MIHTCKAMDPDCMHAGSGRDPSYCPDCGDPTLDPRQYRPRDPSLRRHKAAKGECSFCDAQRSDFHPPHDASPRCESGKHSHCSCDLCF